MKILILGDGLLGTEFRKQFGWDYISRKKNGFDFQNLDSFKDLMIGYDTIINCIANCDTYNKEKTKSWNVNYKATASLVDHLEKENKKIVHVGTDQLYSNSTSNASEKDIPVHTQNWYSYSKLLADGYIQLKMSKYLIFRGTHKKTPFEYDLGMVEQIGNFDYVDVMADLMGNLVLKNKEGIYNIGTEKKSAYELGIKTRKDIKKYYGKFFDSQPTDLSMNVDKLKKALEDE